MGASHLAAAMPARPRCSPPSQPPAAPSSAGSSSPAFSVACLLFGLAGFLAADAAVSRGSTGVAPRGRCLESSHPLSVSVAWDWRPRDAADASAAELPASLASGSRGRYKVMAFVGIFTWFGSVGRRRALRRTWLPADRQFSQSVFAERRRLLASSLVSSISATPRAPAWPRRAGRLRKTSWSSEMPWKHLASTHTGLAKQITEQLKAKQYADAEKSWRDLESVVQENSNGVNFYNFLKDESSENAATTQRKRSFASFSKNGYSKCLSSNVTREGGLDGLMNTVIKNKLRIIPKNVSWREQSDDVFEALAGDFMKPRIHEVDELLKLGVDVTIYSGQPKTKAYTYI